MDELCSAYDLLSIPSQRFFPWMTFIIGMHVLGFDLLINWGKRRKGDSTRISLARNGIVIAILLISVSGEIYRYLWEQKVRASLARGEIVTVEGDIQWVRKSKRTGAFAIHDAVFDYYARLGDADTMCFVGMKQCLSSGALSPGRKARVSFVRGLGETAREGFGEPNHGVVTKLELPCNTGP